MLGEQLPQTSDAFHVLQVPSHLSVLVGIS